MATSDGDSEFDCERANLNASQKVVCVTGASGYVASWLVKLLLQRGYTVRATVRDLSDPKKTDHLRALDGATERLHLFKADLLDEGSFDTAIEGCHGVFHTASPCQATATDPKTELIDPAVKGTLNVLRSCSKYPSVKRIVVTSSINAVTHNGKPLNSDVVVDEMWFSSPEFCEQSQLWYHLSKTLTEEAAWKFSKENGLDMVVINPGFVIGPLLQPTLNATSSIILNLINDSTPSQKNSKTLAWSSPPLPPPSVATSSLLRICLLSQPQLTNLGELSSLPLTLNYSINMKHLINFGKVNLGDMVWCSPVGCSSLLV
ncbi:hypothetical protein LUZ61_007573 [Rhynchospora tenuis]|uniref:NAD-dependent epimerase/dehydratase domain-containing protein n=1 Tax=Rhynchospora tenuis TaxID=198213 RepID=A0AAD5ZTW5_9POAL|nr:hypothetical protein LUZ61_007573 [Rhynchospora tenuis]